MHRPLAAARLTTLLLLCLVLLVQTLAAQALIGPNDAKTGTLMFKTSTTGRYVHAPAVATDFDVKVTGPIIRTRLTQYFVNPADGWVEGLYVFPLPETAAVDTLRIVSGTRIIVGRVKERQEAKAIYETAKAAGKKAALVEQIRPNMFTNAVANIGPGETVVVQIEYQARVRQSQGRFSLRLPTVVAPRYRSSLGAVAPQSVSGEACTKAVTQDRDGALPTLDVLDPGQSEPTNPLTITVSLDPGFELASLVSPHHDILAREDGDRHIVTLKTMAVADRDFELVWTLAQLETPKAELFHERSGDADYVMIQVTPPTARAATPRPAREMIFVIDNSGSMAGPSMTQAKASLIEALDRLEPGNTFNIVRFDNTLERLFSGVVFATPDNIRKAKRFVVSLQAEGGTEMLPAMAAALTLDDESNPAAVRQVIFLTDGAINNEQGLFEIIASRRGRSRIFMAGIGSAPNSFLMNRAAEIGRGTFTHIGSAEQVAERMAELTNKLSTPAMTGLTAKFSERGADVTPDPLPDVYAGEPLYVFARMTSLKGSLALSGQAGDDPWNLTLDLTKAQPGSGIAKLWARRAIANAEVGRTLGTLSAGQADQTILALALDHQLVSRLTSLVAVDETPDRPADTPLARADVPLNLPAGWQFDKVFGAKPPVRKASAHAAIAVAYQPKPKSAQMLLALPQGATPADLLLIIGLALSITGLATLALARRRHA